MAFGTTAPQQRPTIQPLNGLDARQYDLFGMASGDRHQASAKAVALQTVRSLRAQAAERAARSGRGTQEVLRGKVLTLVSQPPKGFDRWGSTKTRAWIHMAVEFTRKARESTTSAEELEGMVRQVSAISTWTQQECAAFVEAGAA